MKEYALVCVSMCDGFGEGNSIKFCYHYHGYLPRRPFRASSNNYWGTGTDVETPRRPEKSDTLYRMTMLWRFGSWNNDWGGATSSKLPD